MGDRWSGSFPPPGAGDGKVGLSDSGDRADPRHPGRVGTMSQSLEGVLNELDRNAQTRQWDDNLSQEESVAVILIDEGVRGYHGSMTCPLAVYLGNKGFLEPMVGPYSVSVLDSASRVRLPWRLRRFVHAFDSGEFPQLER